MLDKRAVPAYLVSAGPAAFLFRTAVLDFVGWLCGEDEPGLGSSSLGSAALFLFFNINEKV